MTAQEAIEALKFNGGLEISGNAEKVTKFFEGLDVAIKALEKQIPYKPQEYEDKYYACKCGNALLRKWEKYPTKLMPKSRGLICCLVCGQKLDWSE